MHRIIHLWLEPTLAQTQETINTARNEISAVAWYTGTFTTRALFEACAEDINARLGLSLAMARRSIASVAATYRVQRRAHQRFRLLQSIPYDRHTLRIDGKEQSMTIWTLLGWLRISFVTDAPSLNGWSLPSLMQLRATWALLLVVPDREHT